ncbi:MAG: rhodanese-like domain-containing protein [Betaproteobacteria bacterium]
MRQLSVFELKAMLTGEPSAKPLLLDVREPWEFQLAHIDGSELYPMQSIPNQVDKLDRSHPTVVICHHGTRSLQVVAFLERQGFENLHNLQGGIDAWARHVDTSVALY